MLNGICSSLLNLLDQEEFESEEEFLQKYGDIKAAEQVVTLCQNLWSITLAKRNSEYNVMYFGKIMKFWILHPYAIGLFYWSSSIYPLVSYIYLESAVINSVVCSQIKDLQDYILRPRLLRRMKEDVEKSIPLKEEVDLLLRISKTCFSFLFCDCTCIKLSK